MKTTKSIIVVLFVLLTAQIASAYYCPSTGRWLSRDPIGEPGFQVSQVAAQVHTTATSNRWINRDPNNHGLGLNLCAFVGNDAINNKDNLGMMKYSEIQDLQRQLDAKYSKMCCWFFCNTLRLQYDVDGYAVGTTVTGKATTHFDGCIYKTYFFWWTCYQAVREGGNNSRDQGWEPGSGSYSDTENPNIFSTTTGINWPFDPFNIAMESSAIVIVCIHGQMHAVLIQGSDELDWTWNNGYQQWNDPPGKNVK
jgi:hypothetical protein